MNRDDIIRLAQEAGGRIEHIGTNIAWFEFLPKNLEHFAALIAAAERERIKQANAPEIEKINAHIKTLEKAVVSERERIAAWVEDMCAGLDAKTIANGIRNGGNDDIRAFEVRK